MRKLLTAFLLFVLAFSTSGYASTPYSLSYSDIQDGLGSEARRDITEYTTRDGTIIKIGNLLRLEKPTGLATTAPSYTLSTAVSFSYFKYVFNGTMAASMSKAALSPDPSIVNAPGDLTLVEVQVTRIHLGGTNRKPYVWAECELLHSREARNLSGVVTVSDIDAAFRSGEVSLISTPQE